MAGIANLQVEVVSPLEVEGVYPRSTCTIKVSILALVVLQIVILLDKVPESNAVVIADEFDFRVVAWNVHQVIGQSVAVDVVAVGIAVARGRIAAIEQREVVFAVFVADVGNHAVWSNKP